MYSRALVIRIFRSRSRSISGSGMLPVTSATISGFVPQVTCGAISEASICTSRLKTDPGSVLSLPVFESLAPLRSSRRHRLASHVVEHLLVRRDETRPRTSFDGHVTDGHPGLDRQLVDCVAVIFDRVADGPTATDRSNQE